ncbi:MAG: MBL fold metallo-hydrolase [Clostridia bacterium]|nr:MBL fold metallo-hydrolase [Clostridia bacterium]
MRLIFIGTSHGVPEAQRRCSSYLLEVNSSYYVIDMGTPIISELRRRGIPVSSVRLVACTHPHGDHTNGLPSFVDLINWYFVDANPEILLPSERMIPPLRGWIDANGGGDVREDVKISSYEPGLIYKDENVSVTAIATKHCERSHAFLVEAEGKKIIFSGDLKHPSVDFPKIAYEEPIDLILCELAHFSPNDCVSEFDRMKVKHVIQTHINPMWEPQLASQLAKRHPYEYSAANDGLEIML